MRNNARSGILAAAALTVALGSPAWAAGHAGAGPAVFPGCSWPVETTPTKANVAAPDSYATYWTTPFLAGPGDAVKIRGSFPTSRFMSFVVYNDSFQDFTNVVGGRNVPSDLSDYQNPAGSGLEEPVADQQRRAAAELHRPDPADGDGRTAAGGERHPDDRPECAR